MLTEIMVASFVFGAGASFGYWLCKTKKFNF
jgi:hypothetical protein